MLARAHTFTIEGLQTRHVIVEVDIRPGLPGFAIVGLADAAVARERQACQRAPRARVEPRPGRWVGVCLPPPEQEEISHVIRTCREVHRREC